MCLPEKPCRNLVKYIPYTHTFYRTTVSVECSRRIPEQERRTLTTGTTMFGTYNVMQSKKTGHVQKGNFKKMDKQ